MKPDHTNLLNEARLHQHNQEWPQAINSYEYLIRQYPSDAQLWHELGLIYVQVDDMRDALRCFERASEHDPENPNLLNNLGNAQKSSGQMDAAERSYLKAIKISPAYAEAWHNLAYLYQQRGETAKALHAWKKALHTRPDYHDAHYSLGLMLLRETKLPEAMIQFENVLRLNPENMQAHHYLAVMALHEEQLDKAKQHLETILQYNPEKVETLVNMGVLLLKKQRAQEAINYFSKALALDNTHIEARNNLAATFMHHDRYENALQHYSVLLETEPDNIEYLYNSGVAQMALGHLSEARQCFHRILSMNANHHPSLNNLAAIAIRLEEPEKAMQFLKKALEEKPDDTISQHMLSALQGEHFQQKSCPEYARNLFNNYALYYDKHLRDTLNYKLPEEIELLLEEHGVYRAKHTLDLGCGSGLCGEKLRPISQTLEGVDISPKMLVQAQEKKIYDKLTEQELILFLTEHQTQYDLIVAADVLPYFGDLSELFALISQRLEAEGHAVVSCEVNTDTPWFLQNNGRFSHQPKYVLSLLEQNSLKIVEQKTVKGRTQDHQPILMQLYFLQKYPNPEAT